MICDDGAAGHRADDAEIEIQVWHVIVKRELLSITITQASTRPSQIQRSAITGAADAISFRAVVMLLGGHEQPGLEISRSQGLRRMQTEEIEERGALFDDVAISVAEHFHRPCGSYCSTWAAGRWLWPR